MKTIAEIRRDNLLILISEHGTTAALNTRVGMTRTDATLSQIKNRSPDSKTGAPKGMGDALARRIEVSLGLEVGWMDNSQVPHSYRTQRMSAALAVMEVLDDQHLELAIKLIGTLKHAPPDN